MSEQSVQRRLAAILYADVAGYSRLTGVDEVGTHEALRTGLAILTKSIESNGGRVNHYAGDAVLAEFGSVVDCVNTAVEVQKKIEDENDDLADDKKLLFRVGINLGEVIVDGSEIYGEGVNIAARLESLAEPGGVWLSGLVADQVRHRIEMEIEDMGDHEVKNIELPIRAYRIRRDRRIKQAELVSSQMPSIAVLPFDNLSGDPEQEYFTDGVTEDIITSLSRLKWLHVTARNSTFSYKGQSPNIRDVAKDLDVRYVLEGSVRKAGNRIRITAQLIDGATGNHLWAERFDRELEDIFAVQDEITETVFKNMEIELTGAEITRARAKHPENLDAWDICQRGTYHLNKHSLKESELALSLFRQAIQMDSDLITAHLGFANTVAIYMIGAHTTEFTSDGIVSAKKSIELDSDNPNCHTALGSLYANQAYLTDGNFDDAISELEHAVALDPNSATAHQFLGRTYSWSGRAEEGLEHLEIVLRLNPREVGLNQLMGAMVGANFALGKYEEVLEWNTKAKRAQRNLFWPAMSVKIAALAHLDRIEEARAEFAEASEIYSNFMQLASNQQTSFVNEINEGFRKAGLIEA